MAVLTDHTMIVNHTAGTPQEVPRGDGLTCYDQRCTRCGTLLYTRMSPIAQYTVGSVVQRGEVHDATSKVLRVKWTAIPIMLDRATGKVVENCAAKP